MERLALPLSTPRLSLEPLGADHADALFPVLSDPRTQVWIPPLRARSVDELRARWAALEAAASADPAKPTLPARLGWAARRRADGALVGKLDAVVEGGVATNVGYVFAPEAWGQGYATEAVGAVVAHLLGAGVRELRATVTVGNDASCRVLERLGFTRRARLVGSETLRGDPHDDWLYVRADLPAPSARVSRGELYWLAPDAARGPAPPYAHPHVVVQDDVFNHSRIATVVVCATSTNLRRATEPGNVLLDPGEGDLPRRSVVVVSRIESVDKVRLGPRIGALSDARVEQILAGLRFQQRAFLPP